MSAEGNKSFSHSCHLCGVATESYVEDYITKPEKPRDKFFIRKVSLCESCFKPLYPSPANMQTLYFWSVIFPIIEAVKT